jgi:hypothetical protein
MVSVFGESVVMIIPFLAEKYKCDEDGGGLVMMSCALPEPQQTLCAMWNASALASGCTVASEWLSIPQLTLRQSVPRAPIQGQCAIT